MGYRKLGPEVNKNRIQELRAQGKSVKEIAKMYGCSRVTVFSRLKGGYPSSRACNPDVYIGERRGCQTARSLLESDGKIMAQCDCGNERKVSYGTWSNWKSYVPHNRFHPYKKGYRNVLTQSRARKLRAQGKSYEKIATMYGCSKSLVYNRIRGPNPSSPTPKGCYACRGSLEMGLDKGRIRELRAQGKSVKEIASIYGCSRGTVYNRIRGDIPPSRDRFGRDTHYRVRNPDVFIGERRGGQTAKSLPNRDGRLRVQCDCGHERTIGYESWYKWKRSPPRACSPSCERVRKYAKATLEIRPNILNLVHPHKRWILKETLGGQSQAQIAKSVGISQPSVSYALNSTLTRCAQVPAYKRPLRKNVTEFIENYGLKEKEKKVILAMYDCNNHQTDAGSLLGRSQGSVHYTHAVALSKLPAGHAITQWLAPWSRVEYIGSEDKMRWASEIPQGTDLSGEELHRMAAALVSIKSPSRD